MLLHQGLTLLYILDSSMGIKKNIFSKKSVYILIIIFLSIPFIQQMSNLVWEMPLKGAVKIFNKPNLTYNSWFNGSYQSQMERYVNTNFGFRPIYVRLHNQINYWAFRKISTKRIVMGKEGYLHQMGYIEEYLGLNFLGKDTINQKILKLKSVSDSLTERNIDLVVVLAAGKASYFPEYFPDGFDTVTKVISNYEYFSKALDSAKILNIDFNSWFVSMKDTSRYPLYTKGGIHWTVYGEYLVADSMIKYIEKLKGVKLPHYKIEKIELSTASRYTDNDIEGAMNLLFPIPSNIQKAYPELSIVRTKEDMPVKTLVVGDSYYWGLYRIGLSKEIFNNGHYWCYNKNIYSKEFGKSKIPVSEIDSRSEVEKNDVVFILLTEANLFKFAFGFIDTLHSLYAQRDYKPTPELFDKLYVDAHIQNIKANKRLYRNIEQKAKKRGISTDEMLHVEVKSIIEKNKAKFGLPE